MPPEQINRTVPTRSAVAKPTLSDNKRNHRTWSKIALITLICVFLIIGAHFFVIAFAPQLFGIAFYMLLFGGTVEAIMVGPMVVQIGVGILGLITALIVIGRPRSDFERGRALAWTAMPLFIVTVLFYSSVLYRISQMHSAAGGSLNLETIMQLNADVDKSNTISAGGINAYKVKLALTAKKYLNASRVTFKEFPRDLQGFADNPGLEELATNAWTYELIDGGNNFVLRTQLEGNASSEYLNSADDQDGIIGTVHCDDSALYFCVTSAE